MRSLPRYLSTLWLSISVVANVSAEWAWQAGDVVQFDPTHTSVSVQTRVQQATESNLDWIVLSSSPGTGAFVGLAQILQEVELNIPRVTPIAASGWSSGHNRGVIYGIDPRGPIPDDLQRLLTTVHTQRGIVQQLDVSAGASSPPPLMTATRDGAWSPAVEPGAAWDDLLEAGKRVFIAGASTHTLPGHTHRTYVRAQSNAEEAIVAALRDGASYVAEKDGIRVEFEVEGRSFGQTAFFEGEAYVRIQAFARDPISRVALIADGEIVWETRPDTTVLGERFFLPLHHRGYVRPLLESESGGYRTFGNPVFLVPDRSQASGEVPYEDPVDSHEALFIEVGSTIEASARLPGAGQKRILAEFLSADETRHPTVWLLQNRGDIVRDEMLRELTASESEHVRLGAAYALLARGSTSSLATMLGDQATPVRAYAARAIAQYTEGFTEESWPVQNEEDPLVISYLVRAYHPVRHHSEHVASLIGLLQHEHPAISSAASDKIIALGTRNYRVVAALIDSARTGHARAIDALGLIGDHRAISPLLDVYRQSPPGPIRRATFVALSHMDVPYQDRRVIEVPNLPSRPTIDGFLDSTAARISQFTHDSDARPWDGAISGRLGRYNDSLYVAIQTVFEQTPRATLSASVHGADDQIEIILSSPGGQPQAYRINALGLTQRGGAACPTGSRVADNSWTVEALLPLSEYTDDPLLRFNLSIVSPDRTPRRLSWSTTYGEPDNADRFGDLRFSTSNLSP
jgi:hypothetical protein